MAKSVVSKKMSRLVPLRNSNRSSMVSTPLVQRALSLHKAPTHHPAKPQNLLSSSSSIVKNRLGHHHSPQKRHTTGFIPLFDKVVMSHNCKKAETEGSESNVSDEECKVLRIRVRSNWGHPSLVACSKIDVLAQNKSTIKVLKQKIEPPKYPHDDLDKLVSGNLIKLREEDTWKAKWPPEEPLKTFEIMLFIPIISNPSSIRIWPANTDPTMNIKHATVFVDESVVFDGDFPNEVGSIIHINEELDDTTNIDRQSTFARIKNTTVDDKFGRVPLIPVQVLDFFMIDTYGNPNNFGLSRIKLFGEKGEVVDVRNLARIELINCGFCSPAEELFYDDEYDLKRNKIWKGEFNPGKSQIHIKFFMPIIITGFMIDTYRYPFKSNKNDISVKGMKVFVEGKQVWFGRLKHSNKESDNAVRGDCTTLIFLLSSYEIQKAIRQVAYSLDSQEINEEEEEASYLLS